MRKYLYLITEHEDEDRVGKVETRDSPRPNAEKNRELGTKVFNIETGERRIERVVGLGYYDFDDQQDYEERFVEVAREKLREIDPEYLEKAGVELEVTA